MTDEEFDADALNRMRRGIEGVGERVRIVDTGRPGRPGRIETPRHRLLSVHMAGPAEKRPR